MTRHSYDLFVDSRFVQEYRASPLVLVDAGARGGLKRNWAAAKPHLRTIGFEPDAREYARLMERPEASDALLFDVALSNQPGRIRLYVARDRGLTSIFEPDRRFLDGFPEADRFATVSVEEVAADTLDNLLRSRNIDDVDFVKADTQGSELLVLQGAEHVLVSSAVGVEVEAEFTPIYKGQPLFADVDTFMRRAGYHLFDLRPCFWKRSIGRDAGGPYGQIIWADSLYLKTLPALEATVAGLEPSRRKSKALKAISIALLYGYCDYALAIAHALRSSFSDDELRVIEHRLSAVNLERGALSRIPGRRRVASALGRLAKALRPRSSGWSVSQRGLGNVR